MKRSFESPSQLELWGGTECTVNRVGEVCFEQLHRTGHHARLDDLDLFAGLGVSALRYPVLWERTAPKGPDRADWAWPDERLGRLRELGVRPIVGLLHHGSGPSDTSLIDPRFPQKLAEYARLVAERYPWVDAYTPINEPLTTARFSGLYGFWHPHGREVGTFTRILLAQCRATVLAMRAVREVNPAALLIQNEDIGKTHSTPFLGSQADYENERRWLTFDLLCGRVGEDHPFWTYLLRYGAEEGELRWFQDNACPPDIIGFDHYLSSERFLDHRVGRYPSEPRGGNGTYVYVDVCAAHVRASGTDGPRELMRETWDRYRLPIAVTEAHNGCTREEQMRWFLEMWRDAEALRTEGVDVRAVTAWALLGLFDWNSMVTCQAGYYEPGVFDVRGPRPRPTAMAGLIRDLARGRDPDLGILEVPGWWRRPQRFRYGFSVSDSGRVQPTPGANVSINRLVSSSVQPILIAGGGGALGQACARLCETRGLPYRLLLRGQLDIADPESVRSALRRYDPWAVVNAAGYTRVDDAELAEGQCYRENARGPVLLAEGCAARDIKLLTFSSSLVFDGSSSRPYLESDPVAPLNVYGQSKVEAERRVAQIMPDALVIRTGPLFGPWDGRNFVARALHSLSSGRQVVAVSDQVTSPTYIPDLVHVALDLLIDGERGVWHLANPGAVSWAELAVELAHHAGLSSGLVRRVRSRDLDLPAVRPRYSVLGSERGELLPPLHDALGRFVAECPEPEDCQGDRSEVPPGSRVEALLLDSG